MKEILLKTSIFFLLGLFGLFKLNYHPFIENKALNSVIIMYQDQTYEFEIEPYTTLKEVLNKVTLNEKADLRKLNEHQILKHRDKIIIPTIEDVSCISINHANLEQLQTLNGVGPKTAQRILEYREKNGYFQSIEALLEVKGIGPKTFEKMKDNLCI